jgi:hypothetical protein
MDDTITTIYCLCDDFLKAIGHRDDLQAVMSTAEVMTVPPLWPQPSSPATSRRAARFWTSTATHRKGDLQEPPQPSHPRHRAQALAGTV